MRTIRIEIPMLPAPELDPNYHGHWRPKYEAGKVLKEAAYYCARNALVGDFPNLLYSTLRIKYIVPDKRHIRDGDNAVASAKSAIDGCVMAQVLINDSPKYLRIEPVEWEVNRDKAPMTILEFEEVYNARE